jgi:hypothetical protein
VAVLFQRERLERTHLVHAHDVAHGAERHGHRGAAQLEHAGDHGDRDDQVDDEEGDEQVIHGASGRGLPVYRLSLVAD